jgi:hypothetical protein
VSAQHRLNRKPSKLSLTVAGVTLTASVTVTAGIFAAAPGTSASQAAYWGLGYIRSAYGSPCAAWSHEEATGWY